MGGKKKETKEKPLDKMTAKELRDLAKQLPEITGVHGMNKAELIAGIKRVQGIVDEPGKKSDSSVREIKQKIRKFKTSRETALEANDKKSADIYRRRISRLKKKTRKAA